MSNAREIKSRVTSIKNTQKVTRAMQMVATAKMRRAVSGVVAMRPYAHSAWSVLANMQRAMRHRQHPLLSARPVSNVLVVIIASNRGLCGSFNVQVLKKTRALLADAERLFSVSGEGEESKGVLGGEKTVDVVAIGKKAERMAITLGRDLVASFPDLMHVPSFEEAKVAAKMLVDFYVSHRYDKVVVVYTDYVSALSQQAKIRQLLPVSVSEFEKQIAEMDTVGKEIGLTGPTFEYTVEPSPSEVLDTVLPSILSAQLWHMILESNASKEAAQMVAMKNATEAAGEIANELLLMYNRIRQAKITQEIAEISAGRAALE